jgi:predicted GTPase
LATCCRPWGTAEQQMKDLEATINASECDLVIVATPVDLSRLLKINRPHTRIRYEYSDHGEPTLESIITARICLIEPVDWCRVLEVRKTERM